MKKIKISALVARDQQLGQLRQGMEGEVPDARIGQYLVPGSMPGITVFGDHGARDALAVVARGRVGDHAAHIEAGNDG